MTDQDARAAALCQIFYDVARKWNASAAGPMTEPQKALWKRLYDAVTNTEAGATVLAELARLKNDLEAMTLERNALVAASENAAEAEEAARWEKGERP